jgi:nitrogen fixation protein FixH
MRLAISPAKRWPIIIVTVLASQMAFGVWMARIAGSDPHHAVEPDYYNRAVNWDSTMAQSRRDRALGWTSTAVMTRTGDQAALLQIALTDSLGVPLTVDSASAEALAVSHAGSITRVTLTHRGTGYSATIAAAAPGLWEVQLRARRGTDLFTAKLRTELQ